jgi:hypothetical protein
MEEAKVDRKHEDRSEVILNAGSCHSDYIRMAFGVVQKAADDSEASSTCHSCLAHVRPSAYKPMPIWACLA